MRELQRNILELAKPILTFRIFNKIMFAFPECE